MKTPLFLSLGEAFEIHSRMIRRYGGDDGLRDLALLESALYTPQSGMGGEYFHADIFEMAAAYLFHIVKNHPFVDANKRVGAEAAFVFLKLNGQTLTCGNSELVKLVLDTACGSLDKDQIADFLRRHSSPIRES